MRQIVSKINRISGIAALIGSILIIILACDFQGPSDFEMPTWFVDIEIPLINDNYPIGDMINDETIFHTPDSLGLQIVFEGDLPDTSIDESYLQVKVNQNVQVAQDPVMSPSLSVVVDTVVNITIPMSPGEFVDVQGETFTIPPAIDREILSTIWNQIAAAFDTTVRIDINLPEIDENSLPVFITSVDAIVITQDTETDSSMYLTSMTNNGLPTSITNIQFSLLTDTKSPFDTLAHHTKTELKKDSVFTRYTLIGGDSLGTAIRMEFGFDVAQETVLDTITINAGDLMQIDISIRLRIAGVSDAVVTISETDLAPELPLVEFPSDIELYSGVFADPTGFDINDIIITNLASTYPFNIDFTINFANFLPPEGEDSVKIVTQLSDSSPPYNQTFNVDGYTFANPVSEDSALTNLIIDISAILAAQQTSIPLDGSELGGFTMGVQMNELHFESLQANLIQQFPSTQQSLPGMPQGFTGMTFTNVQIEFIILNQIQMPVILDVSMVGVNSLGDTSRVTAIGTMGVPSNEIDTIKTVLRLSRLGTTTLIYGSPNATQWTDSTTIPPGPGESTIVDFLAFNPSEMTVESSARIDGRGEIHIGASIGGAYRLIAPFQVKLEPITFIPSTSTRVEEMDHNTRSRIRSTLRSVLFRSHVVNSMPFGGEISMLLSNKPYFPLDTSTEMLRVFKDSLVVNNGWLTTDSIYIVTDCKELDPAIDSSIYIFNVLTDFSDCIDSVKYLVKYSGGGVDTVYSYIDTLMQILLPDPEELDPDVGYVLEPGTISYLAGMDTNRIFLLTDVGDHFVVPRMHLNGTNGEERFMSSADYIQISSSLIFQISSTGMLETPEDELVVLYPNGGQTFDMNSQYIIRWKTYGDINQVNVDYAVGTNPDVNDESVWDAIASGLQNSDSLIWSPITTAGISDIPDSQRDSLKIRVSSSSKSEITDASGWYFTIMQGSFNRQTGIGSKSLMGLKK